MLITKEIKDRAAGLAKAATTVATESGDFKLKKYEVDETKYNATEYAQWTNGAGDIISVHHIRSHKDEVTTPPPAGGLL